MLVGEATAIGSALKSDVWHRAASYVIDEIATAGYTFWNTGADGVTRLLVQMPGVLNGIAGRFEWILDESLTHQMFVRGGTIDGVPIVP